MDQAAISVTPSAGHAEVLGRDVVREGVLLTTQYLEEADRLAQRVFVIDHGRMIADDTESPRTDGPRAA
ncbi:hypothetical protein ACFQ0Q_08090 [Streptomyces aureus]